MRMVSTFLEQLSPQTEVLQLSLAAHLVTAAVDTYIMNQIVPEITLTIFTSSGQEEPDYQHLRPPRYMFRPTSVQNGIPSEFLIVFSLRPNDPSRHRYAYAPDKFETREIRLRLEDDTEYTWCLSSDENFRRGFGRPEGYTSGSYTEFYFHKSDVEMNVYYLRDQDEDSFTLEAATITVQCIRNWLSRRPGELE